MTQPRTRIRLKVLAALVACMFAALTTRLWFLQVLASPQFSKEAANNQFEFVPIDPIRGDIMDRNGDLLATNTSTLAVFVDRQEMAKDQDAEVAMLANVLGLPMEDIEHKLESVRYLPYEPLPIAVDVPKETAYYIGEHQADFPGVSFHPIPIRDYPRGSLAAHVVGYEYQITPSELDLPSFASYQPGDVIGQSGVEASYESYLRGMPGRQEIQVNAAGEVLNPDFARIPPKPGDDVVLSIDGNVQRLTERSLALGIGAAREAVDTATSLHYEAPAGAAVVMDPKTGQVLALASNPTFDPTIYIHGPTKKETAALIDPAANQPLLNRAIGGLYPPGSTFKPFIAAAALHDHYADLNRAYNCPAQYMPPGTVKSDPAFHNWNRVDSGFMSLAQALVVSCDTVFYPFGWDYYVHYIRTKTPSREGELMLQRDLVQMGFGRRSGLDLGGESAGVIPTPAYKKRLNAQLKKIYGPGYKSYPWFPGDYINMSIGQGYTLVTPLQMAVAYSAIANGGKVLVPHVAWKIKTPDGKLVKQIKPSVVSRLPLSQQQLGYLRSALTGVPSMGTASTAFEGFPLSEIPVAGKTGTAQIAGKQDTSWFCAMAPAPDPKYVVCVVIEQGGHGATSAAPVVRRILEGLFGLQTTSSLNTTSRQD